MLMEYIVAYSTVIQVFPFSRLLRSAVRDKSSRMSAEPLLYSLIMATSVCLWSLLVVTSNLNNSHL